MDWDPYDLLVGPEEQSKAKAQALEDAIRQRQAVSSLASLGHSPTLSAYGQHINQGSEEKQQMLAQLPRLRQAMQMQAQQLAAGKDQLQQRQLEEQQGNAPISDFHRMLGSNMAAGVGAPLPTDMTEKQFAADEPRLINFMRYQFARDEKRDAARQKKVAAGDKLQEHIGKLRIALGKALDPTDMSRGVFKDRMARMDAADRLKQLILDPSRAGAVRDLTPQEMVEAATSLQSLISPSGHSSEEVMRLVPESWRGSAAKTLQWLRNDPTGTGQQAFTQRMLQTLEREHGVVRDQIQRDLAKRVASHGELRKLDPQGFAQELQAKGFDPADFDENGIYRSTPAAPAAGVTHRFVPGKGLVPAGSP